MADDGFTLDKMLEPLNGKLTIILFFSGQSQLLKDETTERSKHSLSKNSRRKTHHRLKSSKY